MMKKIFYRWAPIVMFYLFASSAYASTTARYPWAETLQKIMDSLDGGVAYALAGISIIVSGAVLAFGDMQSGAKKAVQAAVGISIMFGTATILSTFFSFSGAVIC